MSLRLFSHAEQVATHLRSEILRGRWTGELPGADRLAAELNVNHTTVGAAIQLLEGEGVLVFRGVGRRRLIALARNTATRSLRIAILLYEESDHAQHYILELVHRLREADHSPFIAGKTMHDLGMDVVRIARLVKRTEADAWVIMSGPKAVLEWFSHHQTPAFALFGRLTEVSLASAAPKKAGALLELVDRLVDLGHRRIVLLTREERRKPTPGFLEQLFLDRLAERGIPTGFYNLPDWDDSREGLCRILDSLFTRTPPTALIIAQPMLFFSTMQYLAGLGYCAPQHVSLACMDADSTFEWGLPAVTHITWDFIPIINRVVNWANNVSRGRDDRRDSPTKARLILGGTIGPVPAGR